RFHESSSAYTLRHDSSRGNAFGQANPAAMKYVGFRLGSHSLCCSMALPNRKPIVEVLTMSVVRCPYCVEENNFKPMVGHPFDGRFICASCGHIVRIGMPNHPCACPKCLTLRDLTSHPATPTGAR